MATQDLERLVVSLEAKMTSYEKAMNRALGLTNQRTKQIEGKFTQLEGVLKGFGANVFGGFISGAVGAVAPVLTLVGAVNIANQALAQFGDIADQSAAAGIDPEFFQGVAYQAKLAGVSIDEVAGALATFNKNSGLAAEGRGKLVSTLAALDPALLKSLQTAKSQEERFLAVADAISKAKDSAQAAAIASAAFGDQGARLVAVLQGGAAEIEKMNASAEKMGLIVDRELIARADELGDKLDTAQQIVDLKLKQAFVDLAPAMVDVTNIAAEFARLVAIVYDQFKAIDDRQFLNPLQNQLAETYNKMQPIKDRIAEIETQLAGGGPNGMILRLDLQDAQGQLTTLTAQANQLLSRIQELQDYKPPVPPAAPVLNGDGLSGMMGRGGEGRTKPAEPFYTPGAAEKSRNASASAAIRQAEAVKDLISDLEHEKELVGLSAREQEVMNTLRRAGVDAASEQGKTIRGLVLEIDAERTAQDRINEALQEQAELAQQAGRALVGAFQDGKVTGVELLGILADVARQFALMQIMKLNQGGGGNFLTNFVQGVLGGFASGTANTGGAKGQVRGLVHGQEAVIPLPSGGRVPVDLRVPAVGGTAGATQTVNIRLQDDSGRMAEIADQRIQTASGAIVSVSVQRSTQAVEKRMAGGSYRSMGVGPGVTRR